MTELAIGADGAHSEVADRPLSLVHPRTSAATAVRGSSAGTWSRRYVGALVVEDALSAVAATAVGWVARFGVPDGGELRNYVFFGTWVTLGWLLVLQFAGAYDLRAVGTGTQEFRRVLRAAVNILGAIAIVAYLTQIPVTRGYIAIVIPVGFGLQVLMRYVVRRRVYVRRARGEWTSSILAVGTTESVRHLVHATSRNPLAGLKVVAACVEDGEHGSDVAPGVRVVGGVREAAAAAELVDADIVAVAGSGLGPRSIRELGWALEGTGRNMVMAPGLTEVAGPRVHVSPVEGLPLMWVDQPQFTGMKRFAKRCMDLLGSGVLLLLGLPFLLLIAAGVRLTSKGPALYRSVRTGVGGQEFVVYKFRSMFLDADQRKNDLVMHNEVEGGVIFKMRSDPRVTPFGRILRKFSLDELPQLLNVLNGTMSLVGPRPPLPDEVERYQTEVHRRMLVKPGMTGLWQVSGRSDLSWDEAVRLDLYYVENWSLALDIAILARTVLAVVKSRGAY